MNDQLKTRLEDYLLKNIPISSALGVRVDLASTDQMILKAPISSNINHKKTVFGGSLHAVATLASWCLLHVNLAEICDETPEIVIASSEINYLAPVTSDFKAESSMPDSREWERFLKILQKKGKARIQLSAQIFQEGKLAVDYSAKFVAIQTR